MAAQSELRTKKGQHLVTTRADVAVMSPEEVQRLVYELQVHQAELRAQNEELLRLEAELVTSRDRYRELYELAPLAYLTVEEGRVSEANLCAAALLGVDRQALVGAELSRWVMGRDRTFLEEHLRTAAGQDGRAACELGIRRGDGTARVVLVESVRVIAADARVALRVVLSDVTERRRAEDEVRRLNAGLEQIVSARTAELARTNTRLEAEIATTKDTDVALRRERDLADRVIEIAPAIVLVVDRAGRILRGNRTLEEISGRRLEDVVGRDWLEALFPASERAVLGVLHARALEGHAMPAKAHAMLTAAGLLHTVEWRATALAGPEGVAAGVLVLGIDIADWLQLEAERLQAQKMEAIGQLAGGIAHDFNNLLMGFYGCAEAIGMRLPPRSEAQASVEQLRQAVLRGQTLTGQLLAFARRRSSAPSVVSVSEVATRTAAILRHLLDADITLELAVEPDAWVRVDAGRLEQVIVNLAINARDAMPGGGKLRIGMSIERIEPDEASRHGGVAPGEFVCLSISDDGTGMDEETLAHAFEPFFTTKAVGKGTGLGLSMAYGTVRQAGGFLRVRSGVGAGTTLSIQLPRVQYEPPAPAVALAVAGRRGHETVLVVDDEALVRMTVRNYLETWGYRVLEAADGVEAAQIAADADRAIDLLVTDIVLPGMPGPVIAGALRAQRPGLQVLFMSAYPTERLRGEGRIEPGASSLQKPFSEADLLAECWARRRPAPDPRPATGACCSSRTTSSCARCCGTSWRARATRSRRRAPARARSRASRRAGSRACWSRIWASLTCARPISSRACASAIRASRCS